MAMCQGRDVSTKDGICYRLKHAGTLLQRRCILPPGCHLECTGQTIGRFRLGSSKGRILVVGRCRFLCIFWSRIDVLLIIYDQ